ncbi:MAG: hypothetical protein D4R64_00585 [Porphyromonadaceae bacterium]|nr:MAG: hypothetical protein D4R64_00585 [Porphyromonadaceae bacterium]
MNLKPFPILIVFALVCIVPVRGQLVKVEDFAPRRADTIILERNWRTRDRIILSELEFAVGDTITTENLALALKKIWNLQNFVSVAYSWVSLPDGRSALILTTRDALTIRPVFGGWMEYGGVAALKLGIADHNFLGRNILFETRGQISLSDPFFGEVKVTIPRQLLWKNMSIGAGYRATMIYRHESFEQIYIRIVNPFHEDYRNTFAPDLETGRLRNFSIPPSKMIFDTLPDWYHAYDRSFWYFRVSESVGTITHRRHQEEGYNITGMISTAIGLNGESKNYLESSLWAEYHKLISPRLQFSTRWEGHYSSSGYNSLWTRFGPSDIRGTYYGEISGPLMHLASTGLYYTWLNWDYLAIEQSVFVQYASAMTTIGDWSSIKRHYAIGTGFQFTMPIYPAASVLITFNYNPHLLNWFHLEL